jgi:integrase/recombinase XerC
MEYLAAYLNYLEYERKYSKHTIDAYSRDLSQFEAYLADGKSVDFKTIRRWIVSLIEGGDSFRTVNRKVATLRSYFKYLVKNSLITNNPMEKIESLKKDENLPAYIPTEKMDELLDNQDNNSDDFGTMRDNMIIDLFYMTGIRLSELISLKNNSLDIASMSLKVVGKGSKERIIPLTANSCQRLKSYLSIKCDRFPTAESFFVLDSGKPLYSRWVQRLTDRMLGQVTSAKKRNPHVLRHSFATNVLDKGAELNAIKSILGHANLAATQVYTHNTLARIKKIYDQAHPRA